MTEHDDTRAPEAALRKAVEQLCGDEPGNESEAAQEAVQAPADGSGKAWTPAQETQIRAMVDQIRKLRDLKQPGGGWLRRRREWRARERLEDMVEADGPKLLHEAGRGEGAHPQGGGERRDIRGLPAGQEGTRRRGLGLLFLTHGVDTVLSGST